MTNSEIVAIQLKVISENLHRIFSGEVYIYDRKTEEERFKELVVNAQNLRKKPVRVRKHRMSKLRP